MGKVIFLNAPPYAGKDTAAKLLCRSLGTIMAATRHMRFSSPLKNATHQAFGLDVSEFHYEDCKDVPTDDFFGATPREAYITTAEQHFKKVYGQDFFGRVLVKRAEYLYGPIALQPHLFVPDSGFQVEAETVCKAYGKSNCLVVHIHRPGRDFSYDSRGYITIPGVATLTIQNSGTIEEFEHEISNAVCEFITGRTVKQFRGIRDECRRSTDAAIQ